MVFVRRSALSLWVVLSMSSCSPSVLREMPAFGTIPTGHIVYVDDGSCPLGQVKEVTGGSLTRTSAQDSLRRPSGYRPDSDP